MVTYDAAYGGRGWDGSELVRRSILLPEDIDGELTRLAAASDMSPNQVIYRLLESCMAEGAERLRTIGVSS